MSRAGGRFGKGPTLEGDEPTDVDAAEPTAAEQEDEWDEDAWLAEMAQKLFPAEQYVDVVFVGDRSGSMQQYRGSSQAGTREFIERHRDTAIASNEDHTIN